MQHLVDNIWLKFGIQFGDDDQIFGFGWMS